MRKTWTEQELIAFEDRIGELYLDNKLPFLFHLSGGNEKELKDHFVILDNEEIWDPNKNICAGVRWLFRKREIARNRLKREPSWEEVLMEYKGRTTSTTAETKRVKNDLYQFLRQLGAR